MSVYLDSKRWVRITSFRRGGFFSKRGVATAPAAISGADDLQPASPARSHDVRHVMVLVD